MPKINEAAILVGVSAALSLALYDIGKDIYFDNGTIDFLFNLTPIAPQIAIYFVPRAMKLYGYIFEKETDLADAILGITRS